jgi:pyruvate ferredoxin oxidoreductase gamma subunit
MYRLRFHGRGGQGLKTAGRLLGTAFFLAGFEVQDAPRYGAERRGAPIFAYVRAAREPIRERGIIRRPDLVMVADDTLMTMPAAGVLAGVSEHTVLLVRSTTPPEIWRERLKFPGLVLTLPQAGEAAALRFAGTAGVGAAARLVGVIPREGLAEAVHLELGHLGEDLVGKNLEVALTAYDLMAPQAGSVREGQEPPAAPYESPGWIDPPFNDADLSAPVIHGAATSLLVPTGLWRTLRPVIDYHRCKRCAWICSSLCPDGTIAVNPQGYPEIDYQHCKGCLVCLASCPSHAIRAVPEPQAAAGGTL